MKGGDALFLPRGTRPPPCHAIILPHFPRTINDTRRQCAPFPDRFPKKFSSPHAFIQKLRKGEPFFICPLTITRSCDIITFGTRTFVLLPVKSREECAAHVLCRCPEGFTTRWLHRPSFPFGQPLASHRSAIGQPLAGPEKGSQEKRREEKKRVAQRSVRVAGRMSGRTAAPSRPFSPLRTAHHAPRISATATSLTFVPVGPVMMSPPVF